MNARRRTFLRQSLAALGVVLAAPVRAADPVVEVWKSPECGCCGDWARHLRANGFKVVVHDVGNDAKRAVLRIPAALGSCHTALVGGYAVEGHVPAREIKRLLRERPDAIGLALPGMPIGSPGMEQGGKRDPYDVLLVRRDGTTAVYQAYR